MSGISKRVSGSWVSGDYGIMKTATDTITTLPADVYADGNNATVGLKGNTVQSGTPTPQNPIQPSECGEKTGNLYDYRKIVPGYTYDGTNGQMILNPDEANRWRFAAVPLIEVESGATYLRTYNLSPWGNYINFYDSNKNFLEQASPGSGVPVTVPSNCNFVSFVFQIGDFDVEKYMFTKGSTAPTHFEPYGYKIPILSANTTTPVYLGEVETTRKIKKLVLTGTENWDGRRGEPSSVFFCSKSELGITSIEGYCICSHYRYTTGGSFSNLSDGEFIISANYLGFRNSAVQNLNVTAWNQYLQQQYAAGTPVTVWYVLANEETAVVNVPLRKIGDYADTVSGITIPTIAGANSFDVLTTLKPSEVTVNYKGWHTGAVHECDSGQWD